MNYTELYLSEASRLISLINIPAIEKMVNVLVNLRKRGGRLFFLGVGGGASFASHAVGDFRKIAGIEAYTPTDNISEITARVNDESWDTTFLNWLKVSRLSSNDCIFVFSVGGGNKELSISSNIVLALQYSSTTGATICGIVGRDGGYTAQVADPCIIIPPINPNMVTPLTESFQSLIWHLVVSHPSIRLSNMKWESTV